MRYEIKGGSFPIVVCQLESGEQMITEKGSMVWMTPNMQMDTRGGGLGRCSPRRFPERACSRTSMRPGARV